MFKLLAIVMVGVVVIIIIAGLFLAHQSRSVSFQPPADGHLRPCPDSPNCAGSLNGDVAPIVFVPGTHEAILAELSRIIVEQGGAMRLTQPLYVWATFASPLFGFVDDLEAEVDLNGHVIHLRSASRVGYSDFGANKKRLSAIVDKMQSALAPKRMNNSHE
ncbi:MAG: DUF1499 domain-containing protein [Gammaproteobacteria bacterium]